MENAFGHLNWKFQCIDGIMLQDPDTFRTIVEACVCLHNLHKISNPLPERVNSQAGASNLSDAVPGSWRLGANMNDVNNIGGNRDTQSARRQREYLKLYFNSPAGSVHWQERAADLDIR